MAKQRNLGAERVRADFNPSNNNLVTEIKEQAADLINLCENKLKGKDPRLAALAQTAFEEGAMWACEGGHRTGMITITYHDRDQAAPVVVFRGVTFKAEEPIAVSDGWAGLEQLRAHPHFTVSERHEKPKEQDPEPQAVTTIGQARAAGREAFASDHHRRAPADYTAPQKKAWLEGFDRARRQAK